MAGPAPLDLRECDLHAAAWAGADLCDADLRRAQLQRADLAGARLRGARLAWADLTRATLAGADLRGADLSDADLSGADLRGADLTGASIVRANLALARLDDAIGMANPPATVADAATSDEAVGLQAFERGRLLHAAGRLTAAEAAYRLALAWCPDADSAAWALACLAFDRDDPETAELWLQRTLAMDPAADRARLDLALLWAHQRKHASAAALLAPLEERLGTRLDPAAADGPSALTALLGADAACAFVDRQQHDGVAPAVVAEPDTNGALNQGVVAAVASGDLGSAAQQLARLGADEPLAAIWRQLLPKLAATEDAVPALLATRRADLPPPQQVHWRALGAHALTAAVTTADGVLWMQRANGALRTEGTLRYTHELQQRLAALGFTVPAWLPDAGGDVLLPFDGDWLTVCRSLPGLLPKASPGHDALAGAMLAQLHGCAPEFGDIGRRPPGGLRLGIDLLAAPNPGAAWSAELGSQPALLAHLAANPQCAAIAALLDVTARRLTSLLPMLPVGLCHGDFARHNLLLGPGDVLGVLDWDFADVAPLAWDLARALDRLALRWSGQDALPVAIDRPRLRAFFRGYQALRPLTPSERLALPLLMAVSRLELDRGLLQWLGPLDPEIATSLLPQLHRRLCRAAAGAPELADALSEA